MARIAGVEGSGSGFTRLVFHLVKRKLGRVVRPLRIHALQQNILWGYTQMEGAQQAAGRVSARVKKLAQVRTATRIGCPF